VDQSGKTLTEIVSSVKRVTDIIAEITAASQEQASGIDQMNKAVMQMDEATQQNAALVEETTSACQSMKEQAKELMQHVEAFKIVKTGDVSHAKSEASNSGAKLASRMTRHATSMPAVSPSSARAKSTDDKELVSVGKDSRRKDEEFEEF
jgi:methyl-accepting chemotaxis protein